MKTALVVLHEGFEEIEAVTVIDVLRRAGIDVTVCSAAPASAVCGSHGLTIGVSLCLTDPELARDFDAIALPGGMRGVEGLLACDALKARLRDHAARGGICAAVCAAPLVLAEIGLLNNRRFTCHPTVRDRIGLPAAEAPCVADGAIVTGRSAGCSLPWALALVGVLLGEVPDKLIAGLAIDSPDDEK